MYCDRFFLQLANKKVSKRSFLQKNYQHYLMRLAPFAHNPWKCWEVLMGHWTASLDRRILLLPFHFKWHHSSHMGITPLTCLLNLHQSCIKTYLIEACLKATFQIHTFCTPISYRLQLTHPRCEAFIVQCTSCAHWRQDVIGMLCVTMVWQV